jgi:hypothetical protein
MCGFEIVNLVIENILSFFAKRVLLANFLKHYGPSGTDLSNANALQASISPYKQEANVIGW